jgi:hypothetical protein
LLLSEDLYFTQSLLLIVVVVAVVGLDASIDGCVAAWLIAQLRFRSLRL